MVALGDIIADRFRLLTEAVKGGTASVFRAFDSENNAMVALKLFDYKEQTEQIQAEIYNREAQALEKLDHDCIVKLIDAGRCANCGFRYIAVEWVDGETLKEYLNKVGPLSWSKFFGQIGSDLLDALCHAFEKNVSHRDVSLQNVLITNSRRIKIIDFGQAKLNNIGIGLTVAGWKTPPYSPPEEDTGRHTFTRDPYSFAAIAVRAAMGKDINDHDQLYDALQQADIEPIVRPLIEKALQRDPKQRFENIISLKEALQLGVPAEIENASVLDIPIRFLPTAFKWLEGEETPEGLEEIENTILAELNDAAAVRLLPEGQVPSKNRIQIETTSHRLIVDLDANHQDHLVVIGASLKRFSLDGLYRGDAWIANATFRHVGVNSSRMRIEAQAAIAAFYSRVEDAYSREANALAPRGDEFLAEWSRVLDAMREVESVRVPPLKYRFTEVVGRRIIVELENPRDAREDEVRTISKNGSASWVFKGEIERIEGKRCTLYSRTFRVRSEEIPLEGLLSHDWSQTRKALDRQASAIKRFQARETPSDAIRQLLLREIAGGAEAEYVPVPGFFDSTLNDEKKLLVSQFLANKDLLLVHGPPGTGKTKVIVEMIRQELHRNPLARILLVSQTHVALDNALVGLVGPGSSISAVRIVSGVKSIGTAVEHCSVEARGRQLQSKVEIASRQFLEEEAQRVGVDYKEVELGMRSSEVFRLRKRVEEQEKRCASVQAGLTALSKRQEESQTSGTTTQWDEVRAKLRILDEELDRENGELVLQKNQLGISEDLLISEGAQGKQLAALDNDELGDWCNMLLDGPAKQRLRRLVSVAEEWRLKFATSDDFKAAIIASSRIVAGTCVGFCREAAAAGAEYDLCIVDESSKATTTELLLPLSRCKRAVLVGDHHQLPPFVEYALKSESLRQKHNLSANILEAQLFEALQEDLSDGQKGKLRLQYRMRGGIGRLVSQCFYKGELDCGLDPNEATPFGDLSLAGVARRVVWYDTPLAKTESQFERKSGTSFVNMVEINSIVDLLIRTQFVLRSRGRKVKTATIGVISGYSEQVEALKREIGRRKELSGMDIECNSVHTFQGREVDICIYSVTRNNPRGDIGFLDDWRHLNVALSRARWHLIIVGSWRFCESIRGENPFAEVLKFAAEDSDCEVKWCDDV